MKRNKWKILATAAFDPKLIVQDKERGELNLNRCGIVIAEHDGEINYKLKLILRNERFFKSDDEGGGDGYVELSESVQIAFSYLHKKQYLCQNF